MTQKNGELILSDTGQIVSQGLSASLIIAAVVFSAYSIVLSSSFGVMDDYTFLHQAITKSKQMFNLLIGAGRPLNAVLLDFGFHSASSIENLTILRTITLFGIWLLGSGLYLFSRLHSVSFISSLAIACGIVLLPSFQVYASWAQHFTTPVAGIFALFSAFILSPVCGILKRSRRLTMSLSVFLLLIAIIIYQPIAMLFCTGILLSILSRPYISSDWTLKRAIDAALVFVTAMMFGFIIFKIGQYIYPNDSSRYGIVNNIPEKLFWFFSEPIANALSLYLVPAGITKFVTIVTIFSGILVAIQKYSLKSIYLILIYAILCVFGSYAPNLATAENYASYRSIGALSASIVVIIVLQISGAIDYIKNKYSSMVLFSSLSRQFWAVIAVVLIFLTALAQSNVQNGFVLPNVTELNNLASFLNDANIQKTAKFDVIIKPSSWTDSAAKPMAYDEFGIPSSIDVYATPMVDIVLRSMNLIPNAIVTSSIDLIAKPNTTFTYSKIIDFSRLVTSQRFKTAPPMLLDKDQNTITPQTINDLKRDNIDISANSLSFYAGVGDTHMMKLLLEAGIEPNAKTTDGSNALINASWAGNETAVAYLLASNASAEAESTDGATPLSTAISQGHEGTALMLIEHGASANRIDRAGNSDLIEATRRGNEAIVKALLAKGANPNYARRLSSGTTTALFMAIVQKNEAIALSLIERGADPNFVDANGRTPLFEASWNDDIALVRALLSKGADANFVPRSLSRPNSALSLAVMRMHEAVAVALIEHGANPNFVDSAGSTSLIEASRLGSLLVVNALLAKRANPNYQLHRSGGPSNALGWALSQKHEAVALALIEHGANPNFIDPSGSTPLIEGSRLGSLPVVNALLAKRANPNYQLRRSGGPSNALGWALSQKLEAVAVALIEHGANPNFIDSSGSTPLIEASWQGSLAVVKALLKVGAKPNYLRHQVQGISNALVSAITQKNEAIALILIDHGANPNFVGSTGSTPLIDVAWQGSLPLVIALLAKGADPNYKRPSDGVTPLKAATANSKSIIIDALKAAGAD